MLAATALWNVWYKERQALFIQRIIPVFPMLKMMHTLAIATNITLCADQEYWETINKYLLMSLISFETLF